ncbi:AraC-type DNA-binding protein [Desulfocicer vacuolatum DSM 3385]|uniref:AraC-type DNA-binding protein n=2 Tax=Desulfocicer vacuolatum TaxID=2298 RepID=A0A1W2BPT1_9BACT|nr:AraC-type DNA-binding protein [Desulfocicer vacuolatum DSM 3385]
MKTNDIEEKTIFEPDDFLERFMEKPQKMLAKAFYYPNGLNYPFHHHIPIQFLYASQGVVKVTTEAGIWVVPNNRAVWIPSNIFHKIEATGVLAMRNIYFKPNHFSKFPDQCCVVTVTPLLKELIKHATEITPDYVENSPEARVMDVIVDNLKTLDTTPLLLPAPWDNRLLKITNSFAENPSDNRTLASWGKVVGASERTLARLFVKETGMTFRQWRQQAKLIEALSLLAQGMAVKEVAFDVGYESVSAFIYMFRKSLGCTPGQFFNS